MLNKLNETLNKISKFFGLKTKTDMSDAYFFVPNPSRFFLLGFVLFIIMVIGLFLR